MFSSEGQIALDDGNLCKTGVFCKPGGDVGNNRTDCTKDAGNRNSKGGKCVRTSGGGRCDYGVCGNSNHTSHVHDGIGQTAGRALGVLTAVNRDSPDGRPFIDSKGGSKQEQTDNQQNPVLQENGAGKNSGCRRSDDCGDVAEFFASAGVCQVSGRNSNQGHGYRRDEHDNSCKSASKPERPCQVEGEDVDASQIENGDEQARYCRPDDDFVLQNLCRKHRVFVSEFPAEEENAENGCGCYQQEHRDTPSFGVADFKSCKEHQKRCGKEKCAGEVERFVRFREGFGFRDDEESAENPNQSDRDVDKEDPVPGKILCNYSAKSGAECECGSAKRCKHSGGHSFALLREMEHYKHRCRSNHHGSGCSLEHAAENEHEDVH